MRKLVYRLIYQGNLNFLLRNLLYPLKNLLPRSLKLPPSGILKVPIDDGKLTLATNQTSYLTQLLFWDGYKNFEYTSIFEDLIKDVNCFLDIGANIGYYSLLAGHHNNEIKIYAFEPASGPLHYLRKNTKLNNLERQIAILDVALSGSSDEITFYEVGSSKYPYLKHNLSGEHNAGTKTKSREFHKRMVPSMRLSDFFESQNPPPVDLIKIDTEGTEVEILESGKDYISEHQPIVICETLFNRIEAPLEQFFGPMGYRFFNHTSNGLNEVKTIVRTTDDGIRNCFFVPESKIDMVLPYCNEVSKQ